MHGSSFAASLAWHHIARSPAPPPGKPCSVMPPMTPEEQRNRKEVCICQYLLQLLPSNPRNYFSCFVTCISWVPPRMALFPPTIRTFQPLLCDTSSVARFRWLTTMCKGEIHVQCLAAVFNLLAKANLTVSQSKLKFAKPKVALSW